MDTAPPAGSTDVSSSSLPQVIRNPERRKTVRTIPEGLAYISFEPDNGGIVLNVSEGGLCVNAVAPMQQTGKIHVYFSADSHKVAAECEVAWTDETQRTGGLRFNVLSAAAREQIRNWTRPANADRQAERRVPSAQAFSILRALRARTSSLPEGSLHRAVLSPEVKGSGPRVAFARGLVTGILLSTIVGGALLLHGYRRQFGEALIRLGERFGGKPQPQTAAQAPAQIPLPPVAAEPQSRKVLPTPTVTAVPRHETKPQLPTTSPRQAKFMAAVPATKPNLQTVPPAPRQIPVPAQRTLQSPPATEATRPQPPKLDSAASASAVAAATPAPAQSAHALSTVPGPVANKASEIVQPPSASIGDMQVQRLGTENRLRGNPEDFVEQTAGIPSGKYFELGKFGDKPVASQAADRVTQAGFHAWVVQKTRLWMKSYEILAGPYANEHDAGAARKNLKSSGFTPRAMARKSRSLTLFSSRPRFADRPSPIGDIVVSWEPYSGSATVRFEKSNGDVTTVPGWWMNRDEAYREDAIVTRDAGHGLRTLLEIRFYGARQTLVLADNTRPIVF